MVGLTEFLAKRQLISIETKNASQHFADEQRHIEHMTSVRDALCGWHAELSSRQAPSSADSSWQAPISRTVEAWRQWLERCRDVTWIKAARAIEQAAQSGRKQIAFLFDGGIGDTLQATTIPTALAREFDADITVITATAAAAAIFKKNPAITRLLILKSHTQNFARDVLNYTSVFDLVVTFKYSVEYRAPPHSRLAAKHMDLLLRGRKLDPEFLHAFNRFRWPCLNNSFGRFMQSRGFSILDLAGATSGLDITRDTPIPFYPDFDAYGLFGELFQQKYITVHHGIDATNLPTRVVETDYPSTKSLPAETWEDVVASISESGYAVVQLGVSSEDPIPGVTYDLRGLTNLSETALILKNAVCHVDTEGGLVHLARAVHTRSVVTFGPTPAGVFGYTANINLQSQTCSDCWWKTSDWVLTCPLRTEGPRCMKEHDAPTIVEAVNQVISARYETRLMMEDIARDIGPLLTTAADPATRVAIVSTQGAFDTVTGAMSHLRPPIDLFRLASPSTSRDKHETLSRKDGRVCVMHGSPLNLPANSDAYDVAVFEAGVLTEALDRKALIESLRIVKPGGLLVCVASELPPYLGDMLTTAGLAGSIEVEAGAKFISLRKAAAPVSCSKITAVKSPFVSNATIVAAKRRPIATASRPLEVTSDASAVLSSELKSCDDAIRADFLLCAESQSLDDEIRALRDRILKRLIETSEGWFGPRAVDGEGRGSVVLDASWYEVEDWGVWGKGKTHSLHLPLARRLTDGEDVQIELKLALPAHASAQKVKVSSKERCLASFICVPEPRVHKVVIPGALIAFGTLVELNFEVECPTLPNARDPLALDKRFLGLGLHALRYRITPRI